MAKAAAESSDNSAATTERSTDPDTVLLSSVGLGKMFDDEGEEPDDGPSAGADEDQEDNASDEGSDQDLLEDTLGDPDEAADRGAEDDADSETDVDAPTKTPAVPDEAPVFTIDEPDGTTRAITKAEARAGYLRQQDYTRKTMAAAELRKQADAEKETYGTLVAAYREHLDAIKEPNFEKIKAEQGTEAYLLAKDEWKAIVDERAAAEAETQRLAREQEEKAAQQLGEAIRAEEQKLFEALPAWKKDSSVAQRELAAIRKDLQTRGFSEEEIAQVRDHRIVLMVRDAALYRQMKGRARGKVRPAQKTLKPGTPITASSQKIRGFKEARKRLKQSGRIDDAAAALERSGILDDMT